MYNILSKIKSALVWMLIMPVRAFNYPFLTVGEYLKNPVLLYIVVLPARIVTYPVYVIAGWLQDSAEEDMRKHKARRAK